MKPQYIKIDEAGNKCYFSDKEMTKLHREGNPAVEWVTGTKEWWINNKVHRENGPAIESVSGAKYWYRNGVIHREDGPAIEGSAGSKYWYRNGKRHRTDGPAIECKYGHNEWWVDGKHFTEAKFKTRMSNDNKAPCNGKTVIVDGVEYVLTVK